MDIEKRIRMAVESILENEAIREGSDNSGAASLLDWGSACAREIMISTADIDDEELAQETSYPRMRGLRQLLETAKTLAQTATGDQAVPDLLAELFEKAAIVYDSPPISESELAHLPDAFAQKTTQGEQISYLRFLIEQNLSHQE